MPGHVVAIHTYGSQRVNDPQSGQRVSAYKIGSSGAASAVLLDLFGPKARNVSPKRASYHYVQLDAEMSVRHGYLVLKLTDNELARTERITRQHFRADTLLWRDGAWLEFPNNRTDDYAQPLSSIPTFNPNSLRAVSPSTGEKEAAVDGIVVEKSQQDPDKIPWWWLSGDTYPHRETLRSCGARWSKKRKSWYYIGWELPPTLEQLVDEHGQRETSPESESQPEPAPDTSEPAETLTTNALPDEDAESDHILAAIKAMQAEGENAAVLSPEKNNGHNSLSGKSGRKARFSNIAQNYVGELTGSVSGYVHCYGAGIHQGQIIYLNMGGPRSSVEAIRAKISKGQQINLVPPDAPAIELDPGQETGMFADFTTRIPEAKFQHTILAHTMGIEPNYGGKALTFIIRASEAQGKARLKEHVFKLVNIPVFDAWQDYLWNAGQKAMLLRQPKTLGGIDLWMVDLDAGAWTRLITGGVEQGVIAIPPPS